MVRTLLSRRWLAASALALAFFVVCLFLGRWQYGRYETKNERAQLVTAHCSATPVPLDSVFPPGTGPLPQHLLWTRVSMSGQYLPAQQLMVRNRPQNIVYGYEVLVPFRLDDGSVILVDRGWVQNGERADILPSVPPAPSGRTTVVGWLNPGEVQVNSGLPTGQLASIDIAQAQQATGLSLRGAYVILDSERGPGGVTPPRPTPLLPPDTDLGPHFAYALQWWGGSIVGFVIVFVYARREWLDAQAEAPGAAPRPVKVKKTRIWDEEDE